MSEYKEIYSSNKPFFDSLYHAIKKNKTKKIAFALEQYPEFIEVPIYGGTPFGTGLLHEAADYGHIESCKVLIQKGIDINIPDSYYRTALLIAAQGGHINLVKWLISNGAWVDGDSRCFSSPLSSTVNSIYGCYLIWNQEIRKHTLKLQSI